MLPIPSRSVSEIPSNILQAWIYGGVFTADDLARAGQVTDSVFAKYRAGEREMPLTVAARISRYAMERRGRTELAAMLCTSGYGVGRTDAPAANGCMEDEVVGSVVALGEMQTRFKADDLDAAERAIDDLVRTAHAARAEVQLRRGQITSTATGRTAP